MSRGFWFSISGLVIAALAAGVVGLGAQAPSHAKTEGSVSKNAKLDVATFGSGCFWCTEADFDKVKGVVSTISGYMGGKTPNPTYESVSAGGTGYVEVLQVTYDPSQVSYKTLLDYYWRHTDVVDGGGQFCDRGDQYKPVIFVHTPEQRQLAEAGKAELEKSGRFSKPIAVQIVAASTFTPAEDYHQDYYEKNPLKYRYYRYSCGRDARIKQLWGSGATH
ncbi:peptide-methionine (S)-S-oxide reductase MsrA [Filomicrobium insigne]|nr:peptide-methionine (S)-S-oxide reductase MsrA [Filomicrobium insigne]MCV0369750.1 peptide-methionine (S)-S-oxide reductase MsrA [Filomicrobium sp.]